jgi:DNA (cytosine-5)-methyltransferase 1
MRFGSVCSGIEAASVAWHPLGWEAAWLSEIEPFPCAVLKHHYPDVPNHGDMTLLPEKILSGEVEAPDLFCGGTPCQAFSVAGLRNSLDDARGNLSLTFVGIANAIDHVRSVRRDSPAIVFWENVPGVLNTKDNAFGCFLGALAGESEQIFPPGDKWTNSGCVFGPQRTVAWRVLDAQYFGVAQRRRRVFVVASARNDFNPAEVLFEFEGVRRDIAPSRQARKVTPTISSSGTGVSRVGFNCEDEWFIETPLLKDCGVELSGPLQARDYKNAGTDGMNKNSAKIIPVVNSYTPSSIGGYREGVGTLRANGGDIGGGSENLVATMLDHQTVGALCADSHPGAYSGQDAYTGRLIPQAIPLNTMNLLGREVENTQRGFGVGKPGDPCPTLTKAHSHAVAQPLFYDMKQHHNPQLSDTVQLTTNNCTFVRGDTPLVQPIAFQLNGDRSNPSVSVSENTAFCLPANPMSDRGQAVAAPIAFPSTMSGTQHASAEDVAPSMGAANPTAVVAPTLTASNDPSRSPQSTEVTNQVAAIHSVSMAVRRLTPVECERLQGFPDGYTNIPWRKAAESPDGPRYKALGNSWAVPVVRWIGKRIQERITT